MVSGSNIYKNTKLAHKLARLRPTHIPNKNVMRDLRQLPHDVICVEERVVYLYMKEDESSMCAIARVNGSVFVKRADMPENAHYASGSEYSRVLNAMQDECVEVVRDMIARYEFFDERTISEKKKLSKSELDYLEFVKKQHYPECHVVEYVTNLYS